MAAIAAVCAYFTYGYFITHDAGFGATLVVLGGVWFFWKWNKNIDEREAWELHIEALRQNNQPRAR